MSYFEEQQGLPPGEYSSKFLEIDAQAGPWLSESQRTSIITTRGFSDWDLDTERGIIQFGDAEQAGAVATIQVLGTYDPKVGTWLWAWSNPKLETLSQLTEQVRDDHPDIPEFTDAAHVCSEVKAWALAAAAALKMNAQGCFRLSGELVTFVALFDIKELSAEDLEAAERGPDPKVAQQTLVEYAGPMALNIGGLLISALEHGEGIDQIIEAIHGFSESLEKLALSPVGQGTPAAKEAGELAAILRQGALCLAVPPGSPAIEEGAREILTLLRDVAKGYGAWKDA